MASAKLQTHPDLVVVVNEEAVDQVAAKVGHFVSQTSPRGHTYRAG